MILAAIEGLSLVITRVVMPYFERRMLAASNAVEVRVDKLLPPVDPLRGKSRIPRRSGSTSQKSGWEGLSVQSGPTSSSPPTAPGATGQWDAPGFVTSAESAGSGNEAGGSKSPWKLW